MIAGGMVTLFVSDVGRAVRFYIETLGMKLAEDGAEMAIVDAGDGFRIGLHARKGGPPAHANGAPKVGLFPKMPIKDAIAILENRGVAFEVLSGEGVTIANFRDPDGNVLYLRQAQ